MTYSFRVRCNLEFGTYIESSEPSLTLYDDGEIDVQLMSLPDAGPISDAEKLVVRGKGYVSSRDAEIACGAWLSHVKTGLAGAAFGADFLSRAGGNGFTRVAIAEMEAVSGSPVLSDDGSPLVFLTDPAPLFAFAGPITARKGIPARRVLNQIRHAVESGNEMDASVHLAYDLYSSAFGPATPDARLVMLVTALEALLRPRRRSDLVQGLVDTFEEAVKDANIDDDERRSLLTTLSFQRTEAINQAGKKLLTLITSDVMDEPPSKFFSKCYGLRSKIVHGHVPRPDTDEVQIRAAHLEIVAGRVISALVTGTDYVSE